METAPTAGLVRQTAGLLASDPTSWELAELDQALLDLSLVTRQLAAVQARVLAAFDSRGGALGAGARTTAEHLARTTGISPGRAGWLVHTARALRDELPATAAALEAGRIGEEHVRVIRHAARRLGDRFAAVERIVVDYAAEHTDRETRVLVERLVQQYSPTDHDEDAEADRARRRVHLSDSTDGWWHLDGLLDPATGNALAAALEVFAESTGPDDARSPAQRRADALAEIATRASDPVDRPTGIGHITLTVTPDQLSTGQGATWPNATLASITDLDEAACQPVLTLINGIPLAGGVHWKPLNLGLAERFATPAQRRALAVRDGRGCVHPGCTVPPWRCIAHHITPWHEGGSTDLDNLVLVCRYHHRRIHHGRLLLHQRPDGTWTTHQPHAPPLPGTG